MQLILTIYLTELLTEIPIPMFFMLEIATEQTICQHTIAMEILQL